MTHAFKMLTAVFAGTLLLSGAACENKETDEALRACRNDLAGEQQKGTSQQTTISQLKSDLATAQTKIADLTKEAEAAKNGKAGKGHKGMEEKVTGAEKKEGAAAKPAKDQASAKTEKKDKKAKEEAQK
jgi:hypothetical protein